MALCKSKALGSTPPLVFIVVVKIAAVFASFPLSIFCSFVVFGKTDRDVVVFFLVFLFSCHFRDAAYIILRLLVVVSLILLFSFSLSLLLAS